MEIARPFLLFLLLLVPALYYGYRRSLVHLTRTQRIVSLITRAIIIVLLILSVADLQYLKTDDELAVIFLADLSDSISTNGLETSTDYINKALESRGAGQQPGVIGFTDRAERYSKIFALNPKTSWTLLKSSSLGWKLKSASEAVPT